MKNKIYRRACKNCRENVEYKIQFLRSQEKLNVGVEEYKRNVHEFIQEFSDREQLEYIFRKGLGEYLARHLSEEGKDDKLAEEIRQTYTEAIYHTKRTFPATLDDPDAATELLLQWAEIETYKLRNKAKVKELMEIYVRDNGSMSYAWLNYIKLMRFFNDSKAVRSLCKRGLEYCEEYKVLGDAWLEWEKKFGTIETIVECEEKIKKKEAKMREKAKTASEEAKKTDEAQREEDKELEDRRQRKRKMTDDSNKPPPLSKRHTLFVRGVPEDTAEDELREFFSAVNVISVRIVRDDKWRGRGIAYVDVETAEMAQEALQLDSKDFKGSKLEVKLSKPPAERDKTTLYVSRLASEVTKETLEKAFGKYGTVKEVRVKTRGTPERLKRFAYVEYENEEAAKNALEMDKAVLEGKAIQVERSTADKSKRNNAGYTVHINNLSFMATEEDIINHLEKHIGKDAVVRCALIKDDEENSKGFAFVELGSEEQMQQAIRLRDNVIKGRPVEIKKSTSRITEKKAAPGKRNRPEKRNEWKFKPKVVKATHRKAKLELQSPKKTEHSPKSKEKKESEQESNKEIKEGMSNDDFRKMLLNK